MACLVNLSFCGRISGAYLAHENKGVVVVCRVRGVEKK